MFGLCWHKWRAHREAKWDWLFWAYEQPWVCVKCKTCQIRYYRSGETKL